MIYKNALRQRERKRERGLFTLDKATANILILSTHHRFWKLFLTTKISEEHYVFHTNEKYRVEETLNVLLVSCSCHVNNITSLRESFLT